MGEECYIHLGEIRNNVDEQILVKIWMDKIILGEDNIKLYRNLERPTSPTSGGRSVRIFHSRTQATEFSYCVARYTRGVERLVSNRMLAFHLYLLRLRVLLEHNTNEVNATKCDYRTIQFWERIAFLCAMHKILENIL
jgi:hypothetical protein